MGVQHLPVQPAQPVGNIVQRIFLHGARVGQQQPRNILRRFRRHTQPPRLPPRADEKVLLHRRLVNGIAFQILLGGHIARRLNPGVRQFQNPAVAVGNHRPLGIAILGIGQPAGRHPCAHRRRILPVQQPRHAPGDLRHLGQTPPVGRHRRRPRSIRPIARPSGHRLIQLPIRLTVQPGGQRRQPGIVHRRRRRQRQPGAGDSQRRQQAVPAVGSRRLPQPVNMPRHRHQIQQRRLPQNAPVGVIPTVISRPQDSAGNGVRERCRRARPQQPGHGHAGRRRCPVSSANRPGQMKQGGGVDDAGIGSRISAGSGGAQLGGNGGNAPRRRQPLRSRPPGVDCRQRRIQQRLVKMVFRGAVFRGVVHRRYRKCSGLCGGQYREPSAASYRIPPAAYGNRNAPRRPPSRRPARAAPG